MSQPKSNEEYKETAERYVREQLPELYNPLHSVCSKHQETLQFECELCQTGWMSPQLHHWLRVLDGKCCTIYLHPDGNKADGAGVVYDLTTGQPATEADYKAFCEIVGITSEDKKDV